MSEAADKKAALEARSNTIKQLCDLYRVVIALAVGIAFHAMIDVKLAPIPIKGSQWLLFAAFIVTIVPFFHGAVRHLFATYVETGYSRNVKHWAVLIDFYLLFIGGGLFVALASVLGNTNSFLVLLTMTLGLDSVWGILATIGFAGSRSQKAEMKWALLNLAAVGLLVLLDVYASSVGQTGLTDHALQVVILLVATFRTLLDYGLNLAFYCPRLVGKTGE